MTINLDLDEDQLEILLAQIEGMFRGPGDERSVRTISNEIEIAAESWKQGETDSFNFDVVKIAPVYLQLLVAGDRAREQLSTAGGKRDLFVFISAVKNARAAVAQNGGHRA